MQSIVPAASALEIFIFPRIAEKHSMDNYMANHPGRQGAVVDRARDKTIASWRISREESQFIEIYFVSSRKLNNSPRKEHGNICAATALIGTGPATNNHDKDDDDDVDVDDGNQDNNTVLGTEPEQLAA